MLNIAKRIQIIESLVLEDTAQSLTYAALESRLTIEFIFYERFKLSHSHLSSEDLKDWRPKNILKQVLEEINENVDKGFTVSISKDPILGKHPSTKEEYESIEYVPLGEQSAINLNLLNRFWQSFSGLALHIPVPTICSGEIEIYGDKSKTKNKLEKFLTYLSKIKDGNLLMGGMEGVDFCFNCYSCDSLIKKPVKYIKTSIIANCINLKCNESYLIEHDIESRYKITKRCIKLQCNECKKDLEVPTNIFKKLKFEEQLQINCVECKTHQTIIMYPLIKSNS
ncbi:hypothetical protein ACM9HF_16720 [Colwellia sp. RE-S-Sl-9]